MLRTAEIKICGNASFLEINRALNLEIELALGVWAWFGKVRNSLIYKR
jgi:hypothetical protein